MEKGLFVILLFLLPVFFTVNVSQADNNLGTPEIEVLDLAVNGTNEIFINTSGSKFDYVNRLTFILAFEDNSVDWNDFGAGSPLTNGILIYYDNKLLLDVPIQTNFDFTLLAYNYDLKQDNKDPVGNIISFIYLKFTGDYLKMSNSIGLSFLIRDDLSELDSFTVSIEGCSNCFLEQNTEIDHSFFLNTWFELIFHNFGSILFLVVVGGISLVWIVKVISKIVGD